MVVADDPDKYPSTVRFPDGVAIRPREELDAVQRDLATIDGVTVLIYDQVCAAEKRRRRKNVWPAPFASRILRCSDQSASTYAVSREHPVAKMDIRTSGATIREPATGAIFLPGLSRRRSTVRPSSRSFLQTSLGYACRSTQPIRYAAAG